jgi:FKBP-type peptidyl-prolyl cis-trans isomerase 2
MAGEDRDEGDRDGRRLAGGYYEPGQWVRHPSQPEWGEGQVQSVAGTRVTVNFPHAGKVLVNVAVVALEVIDGPG